MKKAIIACLLIVAVKAFPSIPAGEDDTSDSLIVSDLRKVGVTFTPGNHVTLITSGQQKFDDLFCAIDSAKKTIHLEYFNFRNDSIAGLLFEHLARKASQGVKVRALFDAFGNSSNNQPLKRSHLRRYTEQGIEIYKYKPIRFPWLHAIFGRDHRKIVIIDGTIAYTGGMNVADYYVKGTPELGEWRDLHCRIEGPEVSTLQDIFLNIWNKTTHQHIAAQECIADEATAPLTSPHGAMVGIANREPHRTPAIIRQLYRSAISRAQDSILLVNPYFTLIPSIKRELKRALKRGVKVNLMIGEKSDIPLTPDCSFRRMYQLMKRGANVYIYQPGFHHTKTIIVDGRTAVVGSANLDARSLRCDYELNAVIVDTLIARQLSDIFQADKQRSFILTREKWKQWRTPWQRFRATLSTLLAPFL